MLSAGTTDRIDNLANCLMGRSDNNDRSHVTVALMIVANVGVLQCLQEKPRADVKL
jgi:hypothetical protein